MLKLIPIPLKNKRRIKGGVVIMSCSIEFQIADDKKRTKQSINIPLLFHVCLLGGNCLKKVFFFAIVF